MNKKLFNKEQIKELLKNKNVVRCSEKSITYNKDFKLRAVERYYKDGIGPNMIFIESGFDLNIIGKDRPRDRLKKWRHLYNKNGKKGLLEDGRKKSGRSTKVKFNNKNEEIEYLKTKIKYLNAENDFLAKLRGLKRE